MTTVVALSEAETDITANIILTIPQIAETNESANKHKSAALQRPAGLRRHGLRAAVQDPLATVKSRKHRNGQMACLFVSA